MKLIFLITGIVLIGWTVLAVVTLPARRSSVPILYWTSDANPARIDQLQTFKTWERDQNYPPLDIELDSNNGGTMKVIIQSASGVGSDLVDSFNGVQLRQYVSSGVLYDVTDLAKTYGFGLDKTYPAAREEMFVNGRQYAFPCNLAANPFTINKGLLEREHLPLPKYDWTWDEFLVWALAVKKTDSAGHVTRFAVMPFGPERLWPTNGGSIFNETMTRCVADSPACIEATKYYYNLMFKHRVMPTPVDTSAMAAQGGYGGVSLSAVGTGQALGIAWGRYSLIQLRKFDGFSPDVALLPHKLFAIQHVVARAAAVNAGAKDPKLAARFLQYLTSDAYNKLIVDGIDGLPPNPTALNSPAFLNPPGHPNEGPANVKFARAALEYGVGREYSPFINPGIVDRTIQEYVSAIESGAKDVDEALTHLAADVNMEIARNLERDPKIRGQFDVAMTKQKQIDAMKSAGEKLPADTIDNPVLRRIAELSRHQ
jgi:multiple sugar transport system substrate-binding protein